MSIFKRKSMKRTAATLIFCLVALAAFAAKPYFEFSPKTKDAYKKAISLRFKEASSLLEQVKSEEPDNVMPYFVENYIDFLKIYIDEDYNEFQAWEKRKDARMEKLKNGDKSSPYYLLTQAEMRLQWAVVKAKFEEYAGAANQVRKAFDALDDNQKKFPDFVPNKKSLGILHSLVGATPPNYRWALKAVGMSGTIEQGRKEIEEVLEYAKHNDFLFEEETIIMYSLLILHLGNESEASWKIIRSPQLDPRTNPLICFAQASVAIHTGKADDAINILKNRPKGRQYHSFHYLDYLLGLCKLYKGDSDAAFYLNKYVINFRGRNYIKECYQRLAWTELLKGSETGYFNYMEKAKTRGSDSIDGDAKALKAAENREKPNPILLKARLRFDGGYKKDANSILEQAGIASFSSKKDILEFHYRKGRILQSMKKNTAALEEFDTTIEKGRNESYYFACNAALQAGIIKEQQGDCSTALRYYDKALSMKPDEYKNSLHGKAKAGKDRCQ